VVAVTEHTLGLSHIQRHFHPENDPPAIVCDAEKLRQVFVNLFNNAHHAMQDKGGDLFLSTSFHEKENTVRVVVRDTGCGITEKNQARIFDPFFTTKPVGQGTGLGLSVSYGIVHEHGGTIEVESPVGDGRGGEAPGTQFTISLPMAKASAEAIVDETYPSSGP